MNHVFSFWHHCEPTKKGYTLKLSHSHCHFLGIIISEMHYHKVTNSLFFIALSSSANK